VTQSSREEAKRSRSLLPARCGFSCTYGAAGVAVGVAALVTAMHMTLEAEVGVTSVEASR
jgi:F0F1-type ATP synthase membrane subunit c/vacuolar-type H+-ATPase subunit K